MMSSETSRSRDYVRYRKGVAASRARLAERGMSPYDEMTLRVEQETGTKSETWNVIDERWERVVFLTRLSLGIPQDFRPRWETKPRQSTCKYGHSLEDPENVYIYIRSGGYNDRRCRTCHRLRLAASRASKSEAINGRAA